jgi:zinc protease
MFLKNNKILFFVLIFAFSLVGEKLHPEKLWAMPPVQRMVLPNGLVILFSEEHSLPFVSLQLLVKAGAYKDPVGQEGLANLTAQGILFGTSKRNVQAMNEEVDFLGASLQFSCGRDYSTMNLRVLKKDLDRGFNLFWEALTQPTFPEEEVQGEIEKTHAAIQAAEDQPGVVADKAFRKELFLAGPYGHPIEGTEDSLPKITREGIVQFYRNNYHPGNTILTIVGDIRLEEIKSGLLPRLTGWSTGKIPGESRTIPFTQEKKIIRIDRPITQANIILGHGGVSRENPDFYALQVMNYILGGGGFSSRLVEEIRNKRGLAYSVASFFDPGKFSGSFQISLETKNASAKEAIALTLQEMERMRKESVSERELEGAKKYLIGSFPMRLDTQGKLCNFLTQLEFFGLGLDYPEKYANRIRSVTREDVLRVAQTYLHPENYILVVVADLKEAGMK